MHNFKQCLQLDSNHFGACIHLASLLSSQGEGQRSAKYYKHALKLEKDSVVANYGLGKALQEYTKDKDQCISYYKKVIALEPNHYKALT